MHLGMKVCIVLNGYETIKEAFVKQGDAFPVRPFFHKDVALSRQNTGIAPNSDKKWKFQRRGSLQMLKNVGLGKNALADKIQEEVDIYLNELSKFEGKPTDIKFLTNMSTSNVIFSVMVDHNFHYHDKTFQRIIELKSKISRKLDSNGVQVIETFPILHHLPGDLFGAEVLNSHRREMRELLSNYFRGLHLHEEKIAKCVEDIVNAGPNTTSVTIVWFVLFMIQNPKIQEKIFQEINEEIGTEWTPTIQDKSRLKYLNAALMETQRIGNLFPIGVPHICSKTTTLMGFRIPEGVTVLANMTSVYTNRQVWGDDVHTFRPERFMSGKLVNKEELIPFGIGTRACIGEGLAKMELFLYLASMFQRFKFIASDPDNPPQIMEVTGHIRTPGPYEVSIIDRSK